MITISISDFKKKADYYLNKIKSGEEFVISDKNRSFAKITPIKPDTNGKRPVGLAKGDFVVPDDFDSPLPADVQKMFE